MLKLMYITNNPNVATIAQRHGVDRIWVDLETMGKMERQAHVNSVKSNHVISDVSIIREVLTTSELLVRVNPLHPNSKEEIDEVIARGADLVMLPMFRTTEDVRQFVSYVNGRAKVMLLVETVDAERNLEDILMVPGIDEIHIGLNDLHLEHKKDFMFELLANGQVEAIIEKINQSGCNIPYGFGGIAKLDEGMLPARHVIAEHYRLGSTMAILSRSFYDSWISQEQDEIERVFHYGITEIREFEERLSKKDSQYFLSNQQTVVQEVKGIVNTIRQRKGKKSTDFPRIPYTVLDYSTLRQFADVYGESFYLLDTDHFRENYWELTHAFKNKYPNFNIAYSYKTNYIPRLCKIVNELGGIAEVVSDMEMEIAKKVGVAPERIVFNGPYKNPEAVEWLLLAGGCVNIDSVHEIQDIQKIAKNHPDKKLQLGIRVNFDVGDHVTSRFGFDVESEDFQAALRMIINTPNIVFASLHCHFATRSLDVWRAQTEGMLALIDKYALKPISIDLGGGLYGKMHDSLKQQFDVQIPSYEMYADVVCSQISRFYANAADKPQLLIEPGTALVGDAMRFATRVKSIKNIRGKYVATLLGSIYNINPTLNKKNPPMTVIHGTGIQKYYENIDFGGYTCIESDYIYKGYSGMLGMDDYVLFDNAGSYSVVLKPPFILPNFTVLDIGGGCAQSVKRSEKFDDLFTTYTF